MAKPTLTVDEIKNQISRMVDDWVKELLSTGDNGPIFGKNAMGRVKPRGLWDRFKGGVSNLVHGRSGANNPYLHKNQFGDYLGGVEESFDPSVFTLSEYTQIKSIVENAAKALNEAMDSGVDKLRIVTLIRGEAEKLKQRLMGIFAAAPPPGSSSSSSAAPPPGSSSSSSSAGPQAKDYKKILRDVLQRGRGKSSDHGKPGADWLTKTGKLKRDKVANAVQWLATIPNKQISDEDFEKAFKAALPGVQFKGFEWKGGLGNSLISALRTIYLPVEDRDAFEATLRGLGVDPQEAYVAEALEKIFNKPKKSKASSATGTRKISMPADKVADTEEAEAIQPEPAEENPPKTSEGASKLYSDLIPEDGIDNLDQEGNKKLKRALLERIQNVLLKPMHDVLDESKKKGFESWARSFAKKILDNEREGLGGLLAGIDSGALLEDIAKNSGGIKSAKDLAVMIDDWEPNA